jgi:hypothetical protein
VSVFNEVTLTCTKCNDSQARAGLADEKSPTVLIAEAERLFRKRTGCTHELEVSQS